MTQFLFLINNLKPVDVAFFIICAVIIALIVGIYFLIPVFNKKRYQEQRENLKKREESFKVNFRTQNSEEVVGVDKTDDATETINE